MAATLAAKLRFPAPPPGGAAASHEQIAAFVDAVLAWRDAVEHAVRHERASLPDALSDRAAALMLTVLERRHGEPSTASPYPVHPFPVSVEHARPSYVALLQWRAGFSDFLADVWDVIGEPDYDMHECNVMADFLNPVDIELRCHSCLELFPESQRHASAHPCAIFEFVTSHWEAAARASSEAARAQSQAEEDPKRIFALLLGLTFLFAYMLSAPWWLVFVLGLATLVVGYLTHPRRAGFTPGEPGGGEIWPRCKPRSRD